MAMRRLHTLQSTVTGTTIPGVMDPFPPSLHHAGLRSLALHRCPGAGPGILLPAMSHATALTHLALDAGSHWSQVQRQDLLHALPNLEWLELGPSFSEEQNAAQPTGNDRSTALELGHA